MFILQMPPVTGAGGTQPAVPPPINNWNDLQREIGRIPPSPSIFVRTHQILGVLQRAQSNPNFRPSLNQQQREHFDSAIQLYTGVNNQAMEMLRLSTSQFRAQ